MGLVSISPAFRFVDSLSGDQIDLQAQILLACFFEAVRAREIHLTRNSSRVLVDLVEKETGKPFLVPGIEDTDDVSIPVEQVLTVKDAVRVCGSRLRDFPRMPNISDGITFGIDHSADSPKHSWHLLLHRGPLPLLSLNLSDAQGFHPSRNWKQDLLDTKSAHAVFDRSTYWGGKDNVYLLFKRRFLFPYSKGKSTDEAVKGGLCLRESCKDILAENERANVYQSPAWRWRRKRFLRDFDDRLTRELGKERIVQLLTDIGTDLESWLRASDFP